MVKINEHIEKMNEIKSEIQKTQYGCHRKDLIRQYNRMLYELKTAQRYLKENKNG